MRALDHSDARLRLLIAPAGYGKTTLAHQWLNRRPHIWYECSRASSDVAGLARGLADLIAAILPDIERPLHTRLRVAAQAHDDPEGFADAIIEHLGTWPADVVVAIDDYQWIEQSRDAARLIAAIIERTRVPLLITSRNRPAWASARQLLYGDIVEIGQNELSMTRAEAATLLSGKPPAVSRELIAIAQGWPAILALAWHADPRILPRHSTALPEQVYEYIADEIYGAATEQTRRVLPLLALLRQTDYRLLEDVLGPTALASLAAEATQLGLLPPQPHRSFELHPLLNAFLTTNVHLDHVDHSVAARLNQALLDRSRWDDAFAVARGCSSLTLLDATMKAALRPLLDSGRVETLRDWLNTHTAMEGGSPIRHLVQSEIARRGANFTQAESHALHALRGFPDQHALGSLALIAAGAAAHLSHRDNVALQHYVHAGRRVHSQRELEDVLWGKIVAASALEHPSMFEYARALRDVSDPCSAATQLRLASAAYVTGRASGSLSSALAEAELAAPLVKDCPDPMVTSMFLHAHSYMLAFAARYDEALEVAQHAQSHSARYRLRFVKCHVLPTQAIALVGIREFREADRVLERATAASHDLGSRRFVEMNSRLIRARGCLARHEYSEAHHLTTPYGGGVPEKALYGELLAMHALCCLACEQVAEARRYVKHAANVSTGVEASCARSMVTAVATFLDDEATRYETDRLVIDVLERGAADLVVACYRAFPSWAHRALVGDCREVLANVMSNSRDAEIAERVGVQLPHSTPTRHAGRLTRREREVADLLVEGLSNAEISARLVVSESTVKVHLRSIYRKVGAKRRTEAVVRLLREP